MTEPWVPRSIHGNDVPSSRGPFVVKKLDDVLYLNLLIDSHCFLQ